MRITLKKQPKYEFHYKITINRNDLNYANHLGNDVLVRMIQEARIELFKGLGYKELDLGDGKTGIIIADLAVNFKAEGFIGDELRIESHIGEVTDKSLRIFHRIIKEKDDKLLALVETGLVAFDYENREITRIPKDFLKVLKKD